jgi:hypothetical protein
MTGAGDDVPEARADPAGFVRFRDIAPDPDAAAAGEPASGPAEPEAPVRSGALPRR